MGTKNTETVGERLRMLREGAGLTQRQLAKEIHFADRCSVSGYERGKREITLAVAMAYAEKFNVTIDWIVMGERFDCSQERIGVRRLVDAYSGIKEEKLRKLAVKQVEAIRDVFEKEQDEMKGCK
ncbi:MAG: helix-turn-helix transcriptional regulator [Butyrivibrio sp.]|uniref:helix-turn-helix domain-containing protein n=1 Tax=Butyrivibrio sp. TaxID=28121 RepID=UPI001B2C93EC|nr:helix-turn-helix transcriptional regulator [Butyrivibrio sp.]MBO6241901.1 helix-turn-helix transcriptional regulator [Butyrivibrio sp.]